MSAIPPYPSIPAGRNRWIEGLRGEKSALDPEKAYLSFLEQERDASGAIVPVAALFLTNRACPIDCLVCDLWRNTLDEVVPPGAIPRQIATALAGLPSARQVKLYNAGSFFDPGAIPVEERPAIAEAVRSFDRVIVECHPAFLGPAPRSFARSIDGRLEVAVGLETIHPEILPRLNKRMTLGDFDRAADFLLACDMDLRAFVIVGLPWLEEAESVDWAIRSAAHAFDRGATVVSLIPTRSGNGALDELARRGEFREPSLAALERAAAGALEAAAGRGRLFVDTWELERFAACPACGAARRERLGRMNFEQRMGAIVSCPVCAAT